MILAPLPIIAVAAWISAFRTRWEVREWAPLVSTLIMLLTSLAGLGVSIWPAAVPGVMTIWEASSSHRTQIIVAGAIVAVVPLVLMYSVYGYWVFRGKAKVSSEII